MAEFRLTILDPTLARVFDVPLGVTLIGREPSTNLPVLNPQISRRHAQLISDGRICELVDLGSANGTFVNDERLTPQAPISLEDGMRIRFGPVEARFEIVAAPTDQPEPPAEEPIAAKAVPAGSDLPSPIQDEPEAVEDLQLDLPVDAVPSSEAVPETPLPDTPLAEIPNQEPELEGAPLAPQTSEPGPSDADNPQPPTARPNLIGDNLPENPDGVPGLSIYSRRLINFLPGIYQSDFMARFLGIFESIQTPIEWTLDAFDLYLDPDTSPSAFLTWLGGWYGLTFDASWSEDQRRLLIREAHAIYARRGTRWALARILEIYTGSTPEIVDTGDKLEPFTFQVRLALPETSANRTLLTRLIDAHKPAYTTYRLELVK